MIGGIQMVLLSTPPDYAAVDGLPFDRRDVADRKPTELAHQ